jgi:hypothetical protein
MLLYANDHNDLLPVKWVLPLTVTPIFNARICLTMRERNLFSVHKDTLFEGPESLLTWLASASSENQLGLQAPLLGDVPVVLRLLVNDGIVLLHC